MNKITIIFILSLGFMPRLHSQPLIPCGHSHNDYLQKRPLVEAVELGFGSIEIDICLDKNNQIKVAHNPWFLSSKKTIEEMYLNPIVKMIEEKDTLFKYTLTDPLTLIIDIKTNGDSTYKYLRKILMKYQRYITTYNRISNETTMGLLNVSLTGGRPVIPITEEDIQLVKIDIGLGKGKNGELHFPENLSHSTRFIVGQVNLNYASYLSYKGAGKFTESQIKNLSSISNIAHANKLKLRLYACGNNKNVWRYLLDGGVDWINVDRLKKFARFYQLYITSKNKKF